MGRRKEKTRSLSNVSPCPSELFVWVPGYVCEIKERESKQNKRVGIPACYSRCPAYCGASRGMDEPFIQAFALPVPPQNMSHALLCISQGFPTKSSPLYVSLLYKQVRECRHTKKHMLMVTCYYPDNNTDRAINTSHPGHPLVIHYAKGALSRRRREERAGSVIYVHIAGLYRRICI